MTYRQLYLQARKRLQAAGIEAPGEEAVLLCEHFFSLGRPGLAVHGDKPCPPEKEAGFLQGLNRRAAHVPMQYIWGMWPFMGLELCVGEGVLIPREDTAVLVEALARELEGMEHPHGVDLCAGTGAVGLGLCALVPSAEVDCVEFSPAALDYLRQNVGAYPQYRARALEGDILRRETAAGFAPGLDFIASNPPYIKSGVIPTLQLEVQNEPHEALDGGIDGLVFYRAIAELWAPLLRPGGLLGVEIGEDQAQAVSSIFQEAGLADITILEDWAGLPRVVTARAAR